MTKIPSSMVSVSTVLIHVFAIPAFFLGFILIYDSQWIDRFLEVGLGIVFNTLMLTCILIGVAVASRVGIWAVGKQWRLSWWQYALWSFGEIFVFSCFAALYMALVYGSFGYFPALGVCLRMSFAVISYPYIIFALLIAFIRPDEDSVAEEDLVRFADSTGRLKLVIAHDVLLYIEAQEN